jgi:hypothetical protein
MMRFIDKLFALLVFMPPAYMAYRFLKWYWKQESEPEAEPLVAE